MSVPKPQGSPESPFAASGGDFSSGQPRHAPRRGFIGRLASGAAALAAGLASPRILGAATPDADSSRAILGPGEEWMRELTGQHRAVLDLAAHGNGRPLAQAKNFLDAWRDAFHVPDREVNLVIGVHGGAIPMVLGDALWARYRIGEQFEVTDAATRAPALRNVFVEGNLAGDGPVTREQTVEALQRRGVRFLICMNSIAGASKKLAAAGLGTPDAIRSALLAGLLPGVITVPAMVVTLTQLQERRVAYIKV